MNGTLCTHLFHYECFMKWLEKGQEYCAYCRSDMLTPSELQAAAREALGNDRVDKIIRRNKELDEMNGLQPRPPRTTQDLIGSEAQAPANAEIELTSHSAI